MDRRGFVVASATLTAGFVLGQGIGYLPKKSPQLEGKFLFAGRYGHQLPGPQIDAKEFSVLTEIDLLKNTYIQKLIPIAEGHKTYEIDSSSILCVSYRGGQCAILDRKDYSVRSIIDGESGYMYSGHGAVYENNIFLTMLPYGYDNDLPGIIQVYDVNTNTLVDKFESGGKRPHAIGQMPENDKICIGHMGSNVRAGDNDPRVFDMDNAKLTIVSLKDRKVLKEVVGEKRAMSHFGILENGDIFAPQFMYLKPNDLGKKLIVEKLDNPKIPVDLSLREIKDQQIASPEQMIKVNWKTGEKVKFPENPDLINKMRGGFDLAISKAKKTIFATYRDSNTIARYNYNNNTMKLASGYHYGFNEVRSVTFLKDNNYIMVGDNKFGAAVLDVETLEPVTQFNISLYGSAHSSLIG